MTVCFDRGGWSPAPFADITEAGFDLLTWRKGPAPDLPARHGGTRQIHALTSRTDLAAGEVCWRLTSREQ